MQIVPADPALAQKHAGDVPTLVYRMGRKL